jgi:hypothetical protein
MATGRLDELDQRTMIDPLRNGQLVSVPRPVNGSFFPSRRPAWCWRPSSGWSQRAWPLEDPQPAKPRLLPAWSRKRRRWRQVCWRG